MKLVFRSIEELEQHYFPECCKKFPIRMRVTEEEERLLLRMRGGWRKKEGSLVSPVGFVDIL